MWKEDRRRRQILRNHSKNLETLIDLNYGVKMWWDLPYMMKGVSLMKRRISLTIWCKMSYVIECRIVYVMKCKMTYIMNEEYLTDLMNSVLWLDVEHLIEFAVSCMIRKHCDLSSMLCKQTGHPRLPSSHHLLRFSLYPLWSCLECPPWSRLECP